MWADLRISSRSLARSPIFAATAIATLALGIGASSAIFSMVHAVLLQPLPFRDPGRLVRIWEANPAGGQERALVAAANFNDWRSRSHTFDDLALFNAFTDPTVLGTGDASIQAKQTVVTPNLFALLGVQPAVGRLFGVAPDGRGPLDGTEVILSHGLWQRAFGGDSEAIGRPLRIEGAPGSVVVGVMPPGFTFPEDTDFWTPRTLRRLARSGATCACTGPSGDSPHTPAWPRRDRICSPSPTLSRASTPPAIPAGRLSSSPSTNQSSVIICWRWRPCSPRCRS